MYMIDQTDNRSRRERENILRWLRFRFYIFTLSRSMQYMLSFMFVIQDMVVFLVFIEYFDKSPVLKDFHHFSTDITYHRHQMTFQYILTS